MIGDIGMGWRARALADAALVRVAGATLLASPATAATLPDAFDLGRGPQGELCRAERVWNDPAATGVFDRVYAARCRGWTETAVVGRMQLIADASRRAQVTAGQAGRLSCGAAVATTAPGLGAAQGARCKNREGGYAAFALTARRGRGLVAVDGLQRFAPNLLAGVNALTGAPPQLASATPRATIDLAAAPNAAGATEAATGIDRDSIEGRRIEVLDYSIRGQHGEARELATRYLARLPANATPADRVEFTLEAGLSASNLGYADAARVNLDQAAAMLDGAEPLRGAAAEELRAKLRVYRAIDALNRRDFTGAARLAGSALSVDPATDGVAGGVPLQDLAVLRQLNAGGGRGLGSRDVSWVRPMLLRTQALYVRGAALRGLGRLAEAGATLEQADALLKRFDDSGLELSNMLWLGSGVAAERGRVAIRLNQPAAARVAFGRAADVLDRSSLYVGTPLVAQRRIELGNAMLASGDAAGARVAFDRAFEVLRAVGPAGAAGIGGFDAYFTLLAREIAAGGAAAPAATARFFEASQLVSPPAVATQIAQLQKIFEGGSSDAAVRAKTLQDIDREARVLATRLSVLPADARDRAALQAELTALEGRASQVRAELAGDQQFQQATESVASLADLQKGLRPGEAYLKLVSLPGATYAMLIRNSSASVYQTPLDTATLAALSAKVRKSIDGAATADGRVIVLVFDVESAFLLKDALLGGAGAAMEGVTTLIAEPTGPMTQLPLGVLVDDRASVAAFADSVKLNSRDYSKVRFVGGARQVDTAISPRTFLIARAVKPSRAALPYLGLGNHAPPTAPELAALPTRGAFRGQCATRADAVRAGFASLRPVGAAELDVAARAMGQGPREVERADFTDTAMADGKGLGGSLRDYAVVHFATHGLKEGELDCDSPPALVTSIGDGGDSDGLLSFEEIAELTLDANLVVLSACNTATSTTATRSGDSGFRNEMGQAATLNGLARAFLVAGGRAVLTTHWAIPDSFRTRDGRTIAASTLLIGTMFQNGAKQPMGEALRGAQLTMMGNPDTSHPYYWGAFMLVGDGARSMLARAQ